MSFTRLSRLWLAVDRPAKRIVCSKAEEMGQLSGYKDLLKFFFGDGF